MKKTFFIIVLSAIFLFSFPGLADASGGFNEIPSTPTPDGEWTQLGKDAQHSNYSETQVDPPYCYAWKWYEAPLASRAQPVVSSGRLFIGLMNGFLYARDASTGEPVWSFDCGSPIRNSAAVIDELVLFTSQAGWTYALSTIDGSLVWQYSSGPSSTAT